MTNYLKFKPEKLYAALDELRRKAINFQYMDRMSATDKEHQTANIVELDRAMLVLKNRGLVTEYDKVKKTWN